MYTNRFPQFCATYRTDGGAQVPVSPDREGKSGNWKQKHISTETQLRLEENVIPLFAVSSLHHATEQVSSCLTEGTHKYPFLIIPLHSLGCHHSKLKKKIINPNWKYVSEILMISQKTPSQVNYFSYGGKKSTHTKRLYFQFVQDWYNHNRQYFAS